MRECRSLIVRSISLLRLIKRAAECNPMAQSPSFTNVSANSRMKQDQFVKNGDHAKALIMDQSLNHSWIDMKGMNYAVALKFTNCSIPRTVHSVKPLTEEDHRVRSPFSYQTNALFNITNAANRKIKTYNQKCLIKYECFQATFFPDSAHGQMLRHWKNSEVGSPSITLEWMRNPARVWAMTGNRCKSARNPSRVSVCPRRGCEAHDDSDYPFLAHAT